MMCICVYSTVYSSVLLTEQAHATISNQDDLWKLYTQVLILLKTVSINQVIKSNSEH